MKSTYDSDQHEEWNSCLLFPSSHKAKQRGLSIEARPEGRLPSRNFIEDVRAFCARDLESSGRTEAGAATYIGLQDIKSRNCRGA
ncbi:hypothetical protein FHT09_002082 [Xanthomonas arboricola]|uniref:hypothetical protein n=1 Tax=Xanthomonas TaxID=338 RepID=UPI0011B03F6D|nr:MULTISPECIES: hypothetical protein [Xanthomonas]MBB5736342.1 hypothetical protein [Xanthomonas sp. CFBP 8152]